MEDSLGHWIFQFLGRLHPLTVHFPIGLLVVAFFMESLTLRGKRRGLRQGIQWMVYIGSAFAVVSALFGWLLRNQEDYLGALVEDHQKFGIATAILSCLSAYLLRRALLNKRSLLLYRLSMGLTVLLLIYTGHLGSNLTHGENYLSSVLPGNQNSYDSGNTAYLYDTYSAMDSLSEQQQDSLNLGVRALIAHNCYQCHSENKQKGGLILDNKRGVYKGGDSGPIIVSGHPDQSELLRRISLPSNHDSVMPKKGKVLKGEEIGLIRLWIKQGAHWSDRALKVFPEAELALSTPALPEYSKEKHPIDQLIGVYFNNHRQNFPELIDDRRFMRRAYLDIIGLLPEPEQLTKFIEDPNPDKRAKLIDALLDDKHGYAQHWLSFWNDLLRNDYSGTGFITGGRKQITDWLYSALLENKGYDQMVRELVNPTEASEGFIKGIQWRGVVNASQRTEMQAAQNIGQSLMGMNVKCASCHNSFVSNLTLEQAYGFASIFADTVLELNRCDQPLGKLAQPNFLYPELGTVEAETVKERLALLSNLMVQPENGRIYRTLTNRIWKRLLGRGIIEPADEMDNAPWDASVLDWLTSDFVASDFDLKGLIKRIMTSKSYQLPSVAYKGQEELKSNYVFRGPVIRRMSAEQFADAVSQVVAPMFPAVAFDPMKKGIRSNRIWHREIKFDRDVLPDPGKRYFRREFALKDIPLDAARVLISVDHSYTLYINGKKISAGSDWRRVDKLDVMAHLVHGKNSIAIEGINEGNIANPAGILFAMRLDFSNGDQLNIHSDNAWKSTAKQPTGNWTQLDFVENDWLPVRDFGAGHWGTLVNFNFEGETGSFARASLVKQHPFLKALGRPSRENVTTSRDKQATLLQALELTNGNYFNNVLKEGATHWLEQYGEKNREITISLYERSLGREPNNKEMETMLRALDEGPRNEVLQDLFWSTLILPEFQFIY